MDPSDELMQATEGITERSVRSSAWYLGRQVVTNLIRLVAVAVLARQLTPSDFGLVALASVVLYFIVLVSEGGIRSYVIYYRNDDWRQQAQSAFWFNFFLTLLQLALCVAAAPFLRQVFSDRQLAPVLVALAGVFFLAQMTVVPDALVERELKHKQLAKRDMVISLLSAVLSVILAIRGWGIWSLVWPQFLTQGARLAVVLSLTRWNPGIRLMADRWRSIWRYTSHLMGSNFMQLVINDGDTILVGGFLGSHSLGYYNLAWGLSNLAGRNVTAVVSSVAMPAFAMMTKDLSRLRNAYMRMNRLLAILAWPLLAGMFVLSNELVVVLYGPGWEPVTLLLRVFIVFTMVRTVTSTVSTIFNVMGRPDVGLKVTASQVPFYLAGIALGSRFGVLGVATGVAVVRVAGALVALFFAMRLIGLRYLTGLIAMVPALIATVTMAGGVWTVSEGLSNVGVGLIGRLAVCIPLGALLYGLALVAVDPRGYQEVIRVVRLGSPRFADRLAKLGEIRPPPRRPA
jgi:O-antigen/teichoic acid export membrane protein